MHRGRPDLLRRQLQAERGFHQRRARHAHGGDPSWRSAGRTCRPGWHGRRRRGRARCRWSAPGPTAARTPRRSRTRRGLPPSCRAAARHRHPASRSPAGGAARHAPACGRSWRGCWRSACRHGRYSHRRRCRPARPPDLGGAHHHAVGSTHHAWQRRPHQPAIFDEAVGIGEGRNRLPRRPAAAFPLPRHRLRPRRIEQRRACIEHRPQRGARRALVPVRHAVRPRHCAPITGHGYSRRG